MVLNDSFLEDIAEPLTFGWLDYSFFIAMLSVSTIIGIYFGFFAKQKNNTTDYLLGGKSMGCFPVAMSMTASHLSGITLLGVPSEVYQFGTQYAACIFTCFLMTLITSYIFLPVFHKLQLTSTFEYLELRFNRSVRLFSSALFTVQLMLYVPIVVYVPALAFSQVTGFHLHYAIPVICFVCIFYTCIGGLKALIWTDTVQFTVTVFTLFTVLVLGIISVGGFSEIWRISEAGGRLVLFDMNPSPFVRTSFWGVSIGLTGLWICGISINQGCMQRLLAVPTLSEARNAMWITCVGLVIVKWISVYTGLIIYSKYNGCDPIKTGLVDKPDQILPHYVMDVTDGIPGLPGLFVAALVSAALSAMSGGLNTVAGTLWEDFISAYVPESETKQQTATKVMKVIVVVLGVISMALVYVIEHMGEIFALSSTTSGITAGTVVGFYILGMLIPWANTKGTIIGGITGVVVSAWIIIGAQIHKMNHNIRYEPLPTLTDNCSYSFNATEFEKPLLPPIKEEDEPMILFTISFLYFSLIGIIVTVIFGTIASFLTGATDLTTLDRDHFTPFVQRFLPKEKYSAVPPQPNSILLSNPSKEKEACM